ncbi:MAG TPA: HRDC domain-containing protein [Candidatus Nanopelagicales bacterium]|nr:HRDC domain-containing protein [Candidatus Nanopelagicales bacterium]
MTDAPDPETGDAVPADDGPAAEPLTAPREGVPPVIETDSALRDAAAAIAAGSGPVAVDAERASGYRYGQRAYLVQLRRAGSGTHLVDPIAVRDLAPLAAALDGTEWVLHAASQDLPCLREIGLEPASLFDTELAGRLLGRPRVGLAALLEEVLGYSLAKEHSAADWSTRPLPEPWLRYAALDVELLVELRDVLEAKLAQAGKLDWAHEEFEAARLAPPPPPRVDPWRRTSGLHKVRKPRQLAVVRSLWERRDDVARRRDTSPGRVLPDSALVAAALATVPGQRTELSGLPAYAGRGARRHLSDWQGAVDVAQALPDSALPPPSLPSDGPPPPRAWADRDPEAAARLTAARTVVGSLAEERSMPVENLLGPDLLRRICWTPPELDRDSLATALRAGGARAWQVDQVLEPLLGALLDPASVAQDTSVQVETPAEPVVR